MSVPPKIVVIDRYQTGESANPSHENILAGIPRARLSNQYTDGTGQYFCGVWTSTAGKWRVRYTEHEFRAGDAFVVPAGFEGIWEVTEPCKKWYSIFERKS